MTTALLDSSSTSSSPPKSPPLQTEANSMPVSEVTNTESQIERVDDEQPLLDNYGRVRQPGPGHWDSNGEYVPKHGTDYVYIDNGSGFRIPFRWLDLANLPPVSDPLYFDEDLDSGFEDETHDNDEEIFGTAEQMARITIGHLYDESDTGSEDGADDSSEEIAGVAYQVKATIKGAEEEKLVE